MQYTVIHNKELLSQKSIVLKLRNPVPKQAIKKEEGWSCDVFYDLASRVKLSFLQYPVGYVDQSSSLWEGNT